MAILLVSAMIFGCSGSGAGNNPIVPGPGNDQGAVETTPQLSGAVDNPTGCNCGHRMWGWWEVSLNTDTGDIEIVPLREAEMHVNVTTHLQSPMPDGLSIMMNGFDPVTGEVDIDLTITHPFPNSNFRGFDVRGILMGAGDTIQGTMDTALFYAAPDGFRVLNADGYTRWWNAQEFGTPGMFGFTPGGLGITVFQPESTLNPYKYYSDALGSQTPVIPNINMANRGTFSTDFDPPELTRNFVIQFPLHPISGKPIWLFQYAIDASWAPPEGGPAPPAPTSAFPIEANCPEAYHIEVNTDGSTAYFVDNTTFGGEVTLAIEVFDWGAPSNPGGINGEVASIWLESDTLFDSIVGVPLDVTPGSQPTSGFYTITVPDVHPTGLDNQEILVTVRSTDPSSYAPPAPGPEYPAGAVLAAYKLVVVPISDVEPVKTLTITQPNGGEDWEAGGSGLIEWTSEGPVGNYVKLEYSILDGTPTTIIASTENDGSFMWNPLPNIESADVKVHITSIDDPLINDDSDDFFSITSTPEPQLEILIPNGGQVWEVGTMQTITWNSIGEVGFEVKLEYSIDDGPPQEIEAFTDNDGSYQWVPIPDEESENVKVIVTSIDDPLVFDDSDEYFEITSEPDPQITVVIPNGGETWAIGSSQEITWTSVGLVGFEVRIDYTISDGVPINIISQTDNDGSFMWDPIPDVDNSEVKILITSFINPSIWDTSDGFFTIYDSALPEIIVTLPNGGEDWEAGTAGEITWISYGAVGDNVIIEYTVGPSFPIPITTSTENDGSFTWDPIDDVQSTEVKVHISSFDDPGITDESDEFFTIHMPPPPSITVNVPNGGEVWAANEAATIEWSSFGDIGPEVSISYIVSDTAEYGITGATPNDGVFDWDPVPDIESTEVKIKVSSVADPGILDESDEYFTITSGPVPTVNVVTPNGGESMEFGSSHSITWTSELVTGFVKIEYTLFDGDTPIEITPETENDDFYQWNPIPETATVEARVIVTSLDFPSATDESDTYFEIFEPWHMTLTSPNGGEDLTGNGTWEITWDWVGDCTNVKLEYSTDSGGSYPNLIVDSTECDGSYEWNPVPDIDTTTARVLVTSLDDPMDDESDDDFTITSSSLFGWVTATGQMQFDLTDPIPDQGTMAEDIMIYSLGDDMSRAQVMDGADDTLDWATYVDDYTGVTGDTWAYAHIATPVHKFDCLPDGSLIFVSNSNSETFPNDQVNDLMFCAYTANDNVTGDPPDTFWHLYGDTGDPDPDELPWRRQVDFSCGVTGGESETIGYQLNVNSMHADQPVEHDGNILVAAWDAPYDNDSLTFYTIDCSIQGGGTGPVDDTDPELMALAVDDDTDLIFDPNIATALWILGSDGVVSCHLLAFESGDLDIMDQVLDDTLYGTATPVDIEIAAATEFGYEVTDPGFNWLCVLLDNGDGTWSVGVWEFNFLGDPDPFFELIQITDPIAGTPMSLDVDGTDFEIHVLADNGGAVEVTVFEWIPE